MTTIIAVETAEGVTFGWDSQTSSGSEKFEGGHMKVFARSGVIFGMAGHVLDSSVIRHANIPDAANTGWDIDRWVTNDLVPAMTSALTQRWGSQITDSKIRTGNASLICVNGRIYDLGHDTSILRRKDGIYTIGSGSEYARGALDAGASLLEALTIAAAHDMGTGGELHTANSDELLAGAL